MRAKRVLVSIDSSGQTNFHFDLKEELALAKLFLPPHWDFIDLDKRKR
jgi:hypothetical protein